MKSNIKAYTALFIVSVLWGSSTVLIKIGINEVPPFSLLFIRFSLSLVIILPFYLLYHGKQEIKKDHFDEVLLPALFMTAFGAGLYIIALKYTTAINIALISNFLPLATVAAGAIFLREKISKVTIIGTILAFAGTSLTLIEPLLQPTTVGAKSTTLGNILILLSVIGTLIYTITSKQIPKKYSPFTEIIFIFLIGTLIFLPFALWEFRQNPNWPNTVTSNGFLAIFAATILSTAIAYPLWQWGLSKVDASKVNIFFYLQPVFTTALAVQLLDEKITILTIISAVLIAVGVYLATFTKEAKSRLHRHHRAKQH